MSPETGPAPSHFCPRARRRWEMPPPAVRDETLHPVRRALIVPLALAALAVSGCSESIPPPDAGPTPAPAAVTTPADDAPPASAVLPYVPLDTAVVTVTDYERIALQLGVTLSSDLTPAERADFWRRAATETALLSPGALRPDEATLLGDYGFGAEDVSWEAHFFGEDGTETGRAFGFAPGADLTGVGRAIDAGVGALAGGQIVDGDVVVVGDLPDVADSWAGDADLAGLVGPAANGVYLQRGCVPPAPGIPRVEELDAYSLTFEGGLATARLGLRRDDLFTRIQLGDAMPDFTEAFADGVADPTTGRIGYHLLDPVAGAQLALRQQLPFASCRS